VIISVVLSGRLTSMMTPTGSLELGPLWDDQVGPTTGVDIVGLLVPGVLQEVGDDVLEVFLCFARLQTLEYPCQVGLEGFNLLAPETLLEVGLVKGVCWAME
jgi:hypothetical protein